MLQLSSYIHNVGAPDKPQFRRGATTTRAQFRTRLGPSHHAGHRRCVWSSTLSYVDTYIDIDTTYIHTYVRTRRNATCTFGWSTPPPRRRRQPPVPSIGFPEGKASTLTGTYVHTLYVHCSPEQRVRSGIRARCLLATADGRLHVSVQVCMQTVCVVAIWSLTNYYSDNYLHSRREKRRMIYVSIVRMLRQIGPAARCGSDIQTSVR